MSRRAASHAPCAVRYRHGGEDFCGATDTPCIHCADEGTRFAGEGRAPSRPPRKRKRDRRPARNVRPFEDS